MTVVNKRTHTPTPEDRYIGRGSILGNPFRISSTLSRRDAIRSYEAYARERIELDPTFKRAIMDCEGKNLVCFCAPLACHGDVIERLIAERRAGELSVQTQGRT